MRDNRGPEEDVLMQPITLGNNQLLRDYILDKYEMYNHDEAMDQVHGARSSVPTTIAQFKKLTDWLRDDLKFYLACCVPCPVLYVALERFAA